VPSGAGGVPRQRPLPRTHRRAVGWRGGKKVGIIIGRDVAVVALVVGGIVVLAGVTTTSGATGTASRRTHRRLRHPQPGSKAITSVDDARAR
jgi:hypothetical protein